MKKIIIALVGCLICSPMFAGALSDALVKFAESGKAPECKDLKTKMLDLQKQLKEVEAEYNSKCVIDGTVGVNEPPVIEDAEDDFVPVKCDDGSDPDDNGCCTGEIYKDMGKDGFNCCPQSGGDCFPPIEVKKK